MNNNIDKTCDNAPELQADEAAGAAYYSSSSIREKTETDRWFFIADWCKKKGISPFDADNFNRAAMEWAKQNCFESHSQALEQPRRKETL